MWRKIPLIIFFLALALATGWLTELKLRTSPPTETATVFFKPAKELPPDSPKLPSEITGHVSKQDKYVTVRRDNDPNEYVYTWDEIQRIEGSREPASLQFDNFVEWIEFLSKLGIIAAILVFSVGLIQYNKAQKWESEKFLLGVMKDLGESKRAVNAGKMLDSLSLYDGTILKLDYDNNSAADEYVTNDDIRAALRVDYRPDKRVFAKPEESASPEVKAATERDEKLLRIRDCFDAFLNFMERFDHYIANGLVSKRSVYTHLNYYIDMFGSYGRDDDDNRYGELRKSDRKSIFDYAEHFNFPRFKKLVNRYNHRYRLGQWLKSWTASPRAKSTRPASTTPPPSSDPPPLPPANPTGAGTAEHTPGAQGTQENPVAPQRVTHAGNGASSSRSTHDEVTHRD